MGNNQVILQIFNKFQNRWMFSQSAFCEGMCITIVLTFKECQLSDLENSMVLHSSH